MIFMFTLSYISSIELKATIKILIRISCQNVYTYIVLLKFIQLAYITTPLPLKFCCSFTAAVNLVDICTFYIKQNSLEVVKKGTTKYSRNN